MADFFDYVREAARAAGYNIDSPRGGGKKALAERAEMSHASVSRMLAGIAAPHASSLGRLADALAVPRDELLNLAGIATDARPATAPVSAEVIAKLRALRKMQKVSAQKLAARMTDLGYPIQRTVIANLETGRRAEVSIDHVVVAAQVLGVTVTALLNELATCPQCEGEPPTGFTCNTCGTVGGPA